MERGRQFDYFILTHYPTLARRKLGKLLAGEIFAECCRAFYLQPLLEKTKVFAPPTGCKPVDDFLIRLQKELELSRNHPGTPMKAPPTSITPPDFEV